MAKYRVLVIFSDTFGCGKFRSFDPHQMLTAKYPEFFECHFCDHGQIPHIMNRAPEVLKNYDLIHIHKQVDPNAQFIQLCKFLGKKIVLDFDDHYCLDKTHPMYLASVKENWSSMAIKHMYYADIITTTTELFKNILKKYNKVVEVLPNAINPYEEQFIPKEKEHDRLRVGIICGSSHLQDIQLLNGLTKSFSLEEQSKIQFVICGFDTRGQKHILLPDGTRKTEPIDPKETVWARYEEIITDNYSIVSDEYKKYLLKYDQNSDFDSQNECYARYWTKSVNEYATHYNQIDVLLVPIIENEFNLVKSQLKVIEAGFHKKGIIASNFGPYTIDLKNIFDKNGEYCENGNSILIENRKGVKEWTKAIKFFLNNPDALRQSSENLYNTVKNNYSLQNVTEKRKELYLKLLEG